MAIFASLLKKASGIKEPTDDAAKPTPSIPKRTRCASMRRRREAKRGSYATKLDTPLLHLSDQDCIDLRTACSGTAIFGGVGSGKTSGSGRNFAKAFLKNGMGGLVLCAKTTETQTWLQYARETGREKDVIVISPDSPYRFDFLRYEIGRNADPSVAVENILTIMMNVMADDNPGSADGGDHKVWHEAARNLLRNLLLLAVASIPNCTIADLRKLVARSPHKRNVLEDADFWEREFGKLLQIAEQTYKDNGRIADFEAMSFYWLYDFPSLPEKTRGSITFRLSNLLQYLQTGTLRELFCSGITNVFPEDTHEGAIILIDLPVISNEANRMGQVLFKICWQYAALRRKVTKHTRPIFFWSDENHLFITPSDCDVQSLAREYRVCSVVLSQNLSSYIQRFSGNASEASAKAYVAYFQTVILHSQPDTATNEFAQSLFGKTIKLRENSSNNRSKSSGWNEGDNVGSTSNPESNSFHYTTNFSDARGYNETDSFSSSRGYQESLEEVLQFGDLTSLKTGSPTNNYLVGAYIFHTGRRWKATGHNCLYTEFDQRA